jgi:rhodanese-related sulfurtransferase
MTRSIFIVAVCLACATGISQCDTERSKRVVLSSARVYDIVYDSTEGKQFIIVDIRERMAYVRGHILPAIWIPQDSLAKALQATPQNTAIILYDADGTRIDVALEKLSERGFTNLYAMSDGFNGWMKKGYPAAIRLVTNTTDTVPYQKTELSAADVCSMIQDKTIACVVIDIRPYPEFAEGHIRNAFSIPYAPLNEFVIGMEAHNFPKNTPLILYCSGATCDLGDKAAEVLLRNDFTNVFLFRDGVNGWFHQHCREL